ncbi:hypothetical protein BJX61DRAFT_264988 [Aspergillus egyptiacus]|nr:hypothetical protein BJX61DRAFT_264988 [Aspergillus egyptiacus]
MGRLRSFLSGQGGTYHSIYSMPPGREGSESSKKNRSSSSRSSFRIMRGSTVVEPLVSPSTQKPVASETDPIAEMPSGDCEIAEMGEPNLKISELATIEQEILELEAGSDAGSPKENRAEGVQDTGGEVKEEQGKVEGQQKTPGLDSDLLIFGDTHTMDAIPLFGRQFGIAKTSIVREQRLKEKELEREAKQKAKDPEALFRQVDDELEALYADYLKARGKQRQESGAESTIQTTRSTSRSAAEACIICLESFSNSVKAPEFVSAACRHAPRVCLGCLAKSIKHDLETRFWDEIKCPECQALLIHEDIKRFADKETFARYDRLSFRNAVSADKNFIWCLDCDFGQLHEQGAEQPMVRCLECGVVSCFRHSIKWHDEFTCDEYDAVLWDPDSYKEIKAKNANRVALKLEYISKGDLERAKKAEQARQKGLHDAQKEAARAAQEQIAAQVRAEKEAEEANQENKDDFREKWETLKRRIREVELSVSMVEKTTKRCPGCRWPIEKNEGCDHMTCIKCHSEFCWTCMNDYNEIRRHGNSMHRRSCKFHTDNLP